MSAVECITYPLWFFVVGFEADNIETAWTLPTTGLEIVLSGEHKAPLFMAVDTGERATVTVAFTIADFDEDQRLTIGHDEIDFAAAAAVVT